MVFIDCGADVQCASKSKNRKTRSTDRDAVVNPIFNIYRVLWTCGQYLFVFSNTQYCIYT